MNIEDTKTRHCVYGLFAAIVAGIAITAVTLLHGCVSTGDGPVANSEIPVDMVEPIMREAVMGILANPRFRFYVEKFRASHGGKNPVVKVGGITVDPLVYDMKNLKDHFVRPFLDNLLAAGIAEPSDAEGILRKSPADYKSVYGNMNKPRAADLKLTLNVNVQKKSDGKMKTVEYTFFLQIFSIKDGALVWQYKKSVGYRVVGQKV